MSFAIIVPTLNAGDSWPSWIGAVISQSLASDSVFVIDSGSVDDTVKLSREAGFNLQVLPPGTFNHGGTRKQAVLQNLGHDVVVFLTQDAVLANNDALKHMLAPFEDQSVAAVCGRQLPNRAAGVIEAHARLFNYPARSSVRSYADRQLYGMKTVFLSNSFAAYRVSALVEVGLFPEDGVFGEDMYVAAKLLIAGWKVAYSADACVYHSHNYTLIQEMQRYFDMGVFHAHEPWLLDEFGGAEKAGMRFVVSELKYLAKNAFWRIPEGLLRTFLRYAGYRLGLTEKHIPLFVKRALCMNKGYFKNL